MCDFCFPKQKVIIEVDGDFWHANPNKYPNQSKLHPHQIKVIGKDKSKSAYITKADDCSWTLLRFWESDIEKEEVIGFRPGEKLRYKLTEDFHKDLQSKGVKIADYLRKADVIGVYCSTDDLSNARAAELKREFPDKEVIVMIERRSNIDEAKSTGAVPWFLPEIVVS